MSIRAITSFKASPFNSFQTGVQQTAAPAVTVKPQVPAPVVQTPAPVVQAPAVQTPAPVTPVQAQANQATTKIDKTDISKILSIGAATVSVATLGYMIYKGKGNEVGEQVAGLAQKLNGVEETIQNIQERVAQDGGAEIAELVKKVDGFEEKLTQKLQEQASKDGGAEVAELVKKFDGLEEKITQKVQQQLAENGTEAAAGSTAVFTKILEAFGLALGGKEVVDIIKHAGGKNEKELEAETDKINYAVQSAVNEKINDKVRAELPYIRSKKTPPLEAVSTIEKASEKGVEGKRTWDIPDPKPWMVSAEVETIVKVGGLGTVAKQLPDAFNAKFKNDPNKKMTIVMPMYIKDNDPSSRCTLKHIGGNKYTYKSAASEIEVTKESEGSVKVYDYYADKFNDEKFEVYKGITKDKATGAETECIFIKADKFFNLDTKGAEDNISVYIENKNHVREGDRFATFSKMAVEVMKDAKEGKAGNIEAPNVIIANDWHAGAMAPVMRYLIPTLAANNEISKETAEYFDKTPIISVAHNASEQGDNNQRRIEADGIIRTLFEEYTDKISQLIDQTGAGKKYPLATHAGNYNPFLAGANLADRMVAVSENYAKELGKTKLFAKNDHSVAACKKRGENNTFFGIVNGYDKTTASPNDTMINNINNNLGLPENIQFKVYDNKPGDEAYEIKMENKKALSLLLNYAAQNTTPSEKYENVGGVNGMSINLYKPDQCEVPTGDEFVNTPVMCNIGRMVEQKGFDYFVKAIKDFAKDSEEKGVKPVFIAMGSANQREKTEEAAQVLKDAKDYLLEECPEIGKRMFIFTGYNADLRDAIYCGSDFAAIPSKWEPCGLTQMEAMAKGAIPVATATGGLVDTVQDGKTGFITDKFFEYRRDKALIFSKEGTDDTSKNNEETFSKTVEKAIDTYTSDKAKIKEMFIEDMKQDFSWDKSGALDKYIELMQTGTIKKEDSGK